MDTFFVRRKVCLDLVLLIALLGVLDVLLTRTFLSLGGEEDNSWLFFSQMLNADYVAGMLYVVSWKVLVTLLLLKGVFLLKTIPDWLIAVLYFTVTYYVLGCFFTTDFLIYLTYGDSLLHNLL